MKYEDLLAGVEKPGRYVGNETNAYRKVFEECDVRFALAFPDVYEVGLSHIGLQVIYHVLNNMEGTMADRVYAPWSDFEDQLRRYGEPLRALESGRPLGDFDILGFSLQYELSFTNILTILDLARIPFYSRDRRAGDPWVIAGGPCAFNPEPLADIFDFVVLGEAEEVLGELIGAFREWRAARGTRREFLESIRRIPGIYVPSLFDVSYRPDGVVEDIGPVFPDYTRVEKRIVPDLDAGSPLTERPLVPLLEIVHDRLSQEIARGCTRGCRFCQAGFIYRPVRERDPGEVLRKAEAALKSSGFEELSLLSLSTGDYCRIQDLLAALMHRSELQKVAVSLPSMRVGTLTPELMELILRVRKTGFTVAPEAASERLRRVINKGIRDEDLLATAESAFRLGWRLLKLYFMIGLPTETREDLDAIVERCLQVWQFGKPWKASVNVSVSTFVPKPHTPFQWVGQLPRSRVEESLDYLQGRLKRPGLRFKWNLPGQSVLEAVFARGDRRLLRVLVRAWELGARFDGWTENFRDDLWERAFTEAGLAPSFYAERERSRDEVLPWDHLSAGVDKDHLWKEYEKALAEEPTPDCRWERCSGCGVCDHKAVQPVLHRSGDELIGDREKTEPERTQLFFPYRLRYSKTGKARFFGQLELSRSLSRAVRRAGLAAAYSKGFHPHMKLSFSGALPLGLESLVEEAQLTLTERADPGRVQLDMNRYLPEGVRIEEVVLVSGGSPSPPSQHQRVTYRVSGLHPWEAAVIVRSMARRLNDSLTKKTKKREITVELGEVLLDVRQVDETSVDMVLYEGPQVCFRPPAVLQHLLEGFSERFSGYRIRKTVTEPMEEGENVRRTHHKF